MFKYLKSLFNKSDSVDVGREDWMSGYGTDKYGVWAEFKVKNVSQRMRWFKAGTFMMGSPEDEEGRYDDEKQKEVTIDKGYWLADTATTQEMWEAVMGGNPSHFKSSNQNPVEQVSFNDIKVFTEKLNSLKPGLSIGLPTEEQWEKAIRDGSPGDGYSIRDTELENINYSSSTTVEVKKMKPNKKGMFQMLGNVWEWCDSEYK